MFSGGKDSAVLLHLAVKAFAPSGLPFPILHVDTGHNFDEVLEYRDLQAGSRGARLVIASVQASIDAGRVLDPGEGESRNRIQSTTLLDAINEHKFDAAFGGARRDEDKARAKERVLSFRDRFGRWDPRRQRPELWQLYQGKVTPASTCGRSPFPTGPSSTSGSTSSASRSASRPSTSRTRARSCVATGCSLPSPNGSSPGREGRRATRRAVPHGRRRHLHRRRRVERHDRHRDHRRGRHRADLGARAPPAATTASARPPWRTASARATSRRWATNPASWTCSARPIGSVDDGKSTLVGRLLVDTRQLFDDQLEAVAHASIERGVGDLDLSSSPTACAPSASRASPSTSPTATRRPRRASSSSPTAPGTCSTRGTWPRARRPRTWRSSCWTRPGAEGADASAHLHRRAAGRPPPHRRRQQDGPRRLGRRTPTWRWSTRSARWPTGSAWTSRRDPGLRPQGRLRRGALGRRPLVRGRDPARRARGRSGGRVGRPGARVRRGLPIQWVLRPPGGGRTYAGMVDGAELFPGDEVTVLPAGTRTSVRAIRIAGTLLDRATVGRSVDVDLADDTDAGSRRSDRDRAAPRGHRPPRRHGVLVRREPLTAGQRFRVEAHDPVHRRLRRARPLAIDVNRLALEDADTIEANEIGVITLSTADPLAVDPYTRNRITGCFVLVDERTNATLGGAMVGTPTFAREDRTGLRGPSAPASRRPRPPVPRRRPRRPPPSGGRGRARRRGRREGSGHLSLGGEGDRLERDGGERPERGPGHDEQVAERDGPLGGQDEPDAGQRDEVDQPPRQPRGAP